MCLFTGLRMKNLGLGNIVHRTVHGTLYLFDGLLLSSANVQKLASSVQEDESSISSLQDDEKKKLSVRTYIHVELVGGYGQGGVGQGGTRAVYIHVHVAVTLNSGLYMYM